jgi:MerR family redox-sensitive transcriptional activator SoxR
VSDTRTCQLLQALRDRLTTCIGCGWLSIDKCDLLNPDDEAAADGPGVHYLRDD